MAGVQRNRDTFNEYHAFLNGQGEDNAQFRGVLRRRLRLAMLEELTDKERLTMEMYYVQEIKMEDIARIQGVTASTVSRCISRARKKLRQCLRYGVKELLG